MPTVNTYARFYIHPTLVSGKINTDTAVYEDILNTEVFEKGSKNTSNSHQKCDKDESDFAAEWEAYKNKEDFVNTGTNLSVLPTIGPSAIMNLNIKGINSVEDLAGLSDAIVIGERGMLDLRQRAQAYLEALKPEIAAQREIDDNAQKAIIEDLQRQVKELADKPKRTRRKRNKETGELE